RFGRPDPACGVEDRLFVWFRHGQVPLVAGQKRSPARIVAADNCHKPFYARQWRGLTSLERIRVTSLMAFRIFAPTADATEPASVPRLWLHSFFRSNPSTQPPPRSHNRLGCELATGPVAATGRVRSHNRLGCELATGPVAAT